MTILECVKEKYNATGTKLWLCPNIVVPDGIKVDPYFSGYECTPTSIPKDLRDRKVLEVFKEAGIIRIIWENIPYVDKHYQYENSFHKEWRKRNSDKPVAIEENSSEIA